MANNGPVNGEKETSPTPETLRFIAEAATRQTDGDSGNRGRFFLFPLAIVVIGAAIILFVTSLTREERTAQDLLNEVQTGGSSRRWQAAYSLTAMVADMVKEGKKVDPVLVPQIIRAFEDAKHDDLMVRRYLVSSLGRLGDRRATPALIGALGDADDETRIRAILSLGEMKDTSSVVPLLRQAESDDPGIQKGVAFALGLIQDSRALPVLRGMLNASDPNVRWNAALALCRFQDRSGAPVIGEMLNRELLGRIPDMTDEQREEAMLMAIRGGVLLQDRTLISTLRTIKAGDPSLKVRQAAIEALNALGQRANP